MSALVFKDPYIAALVSDIKSEIDNLALALCDRVVVKTVTNNQKKLSKREVERIREMRRNGCTQADIASCFDINPATVSRIVRGQYHK